MSLDRHFVSAVELSTISSRYPRTVGRNARLGSHGKGGESAIVILRTDTGRSGWGLLAGPPPPGDQIIGRSVLDLIDPDAGVRDQEMLALDFALHDLVGQIEDQPVYALLGAHGQRTTSSYDGAIYFADLDPDDHPRGVPAVLADCATDDAAGYRAFKLKIGRGNRWMGRAAGDARDIEVTRAVRHCVVCESRRDLHLGRTLQCHLQRGYSARPSTTALFKWSRITASRRRTVGVFESEKRAPEGCAT